MRLRWFGADTWILTFLRNQPRSMAQGLTRMAQGLTPLAMECRPFGALRGVQSLARIFALLRGRRPGNQPRRGDIQ
jgi:hypothetical protein